MTVSNKILIIGATGGVGGAVLSQLLARNPQPSIRVSSRDPSKLKVPASVEVVKGDLSDPSTYPTLFNNVEKVFLYMQGTQNTATQVVKGIKDAGVRHIVFLSSSSVLSPNDNYIKQIHVQVESAIKESGLTYTFLRPGLSPTFYPTHHYHVSLSRLPLTTFPNLVTIHSTNKSPSLSSVATFLLILSKFSIPLFLPNSLQTYT